MKIIESVVGVSHYSKEQITAEDGVRREKSFQNPKLNFHVLC